MGSWNRILSVARQCRAHSRIADYFCYRLSVCEGAPNRADAEFANYDAGLVVRFGHGWLYFTRAPVDFVDLLACCDLTRQKAVLANARLGMVSAIQMGSCRRAGVIDARRIVCFSEA